MADDSSEDPACEKPADSRDREHQRRNQLQADLLRRTYIRTQHAAFIDAALRRARGEEEPHDPTHDEGS